VGQDFGRLMRSLWPPARAEELVQLCRQTLAAGVPTSLPFGEWQMQRISISHAQSGVVCYFRGQPVRNSTRRAAGYAS
jgi:hypothetical protein